MSSTLKCWLIANFEIFMPLLFVIACVIFYLFAGADTRINFFAFSLGFIPFHVFVWALSAPTKNGSLNSGMYFLMLVVVGFSMLSLYFSDDYDPELKDFENVLRRLIRMFWIVFPIASVFSGWVALYTYNNIDEVRSRRMLYRNSNVNLFEHQWKYTWDRFCKISVSIITWTCWFIILILFSLKDWNTIE